MKNAQILLLFVSIIYCSCQSSEMDFGAAKNFFPPTRLMKNGIVNKYYSHIKKADSKDISTDIDYRSYQIKSEVLYSNYYDPDFRLDISREFSFQNNQMLLLKEVRFGRIDTFQVIISNPVKKDWKSQKCQGGKTVYYGWGTREWEYFQEKIQDTIVMGKPAKLFEGYQNYTNIWQGDTSMTTQQYREIYVQDLGLFYREVIAKTGKSWMELVEQIPLKKFKKQSEHGLHRVAYITPDNRMDKGEPFKLCEINNKIYDYYNGGQILHYNGGKKAIWKIVNQRLDKEKLLKESGYLTFRFIVNCKGVAGRFITEQATLDYQKKQFNKETINHFYEILRQISDWIPTKIQKDNVDAYFYLTFKLKEGELIEVLP